MFPKHTKSKISKTKTNHITNQNQTSRKLKKQITSTLNRNKTVSNQTNQFNYNTHQINMNQTQIIVSLIVAQNLNYKNLDNYY